MPPRVFQLPEFAGNGYPPSHLYPLPVSDEADRQCVDAVLNQGMPWLREISTLDVEAATSFWKSRLRESSASEFAELADVLARYIPQDLVIHETRSWVSLHYESSDCEGFLLIGEPLMRDQSVAITVADETFISRDPIGYVGCPSLYSACFAPKFTDASGMSLLSWLPFAGTLECFLSTMPGERFGDYDSIAMSGQAMTDELCCTTNIGDKTSAQNACIAAIDSLALSHLNGTVMQHAGHLGIDIIGAMIGIGVAAYGGVVPGVIVAGSLGIDGAAMAACIVDHADTIKQQANKAKRAYCQCP